jgi:hypothetical protein
LDDVQALYEKNKNSRFLTDAQKTALQNLLQA